MNRPDCPYLVRETVTYRESLDLSRAAPTRVMVSWYCGHPFHGIRLDLGDAEAAVDERCADCALPPPDDTAVRKVRWTPSPLQARDRKVK
jgi:hypothetical protein